MTPEEEQFYRVLVKFLGEESARRIPFKQWEMSYVQEFTKGPTRLVFFFTEKLDKKRSRV